MFTDLRYAIRSLRKTPGFTFIAVATLALSIGACTAIFSLIDGIMLRGVSYPEPDRLMMVYEGQNGQTAIEQLGTPSTASYLHWRDQASSYSSLAAWHSRSYNVTGEGLPYRFYAQKVTVDLFSVLGIQPALGRGFLPNESDPAHAHAIILSHRMWQDRFAGRSDILGRTLMLDTQTFTIVGVMPEDNRFEPTAAAFTPLAFTAGSIDNYKQRLSVVGRLRPETTEDQASTEMNLLNERLSADYPDHYKGVSGHVIPIRIARAFGAKRILSLLLGATACLLLIACANISSLQLVRATSRRREFALRTALGASRYHVVRGMIRGHR